jgi:hypothetical protein
MMTLSLGGEWSLRVPSPLIPTSRFSRGARRGAAGAPAPRPPEKPPGKRPSTLAWLPWRRPREVAVTLGSAQSLQEFSAGAARPQAMVDEAPDAITLTLDAPGARPTNTDVVWDAQQQRLVVGVWASVRPGRRRRIARPELAWYRSHWLPRCDGRAARVVVKNGTIEIVVPRLEPMAA